MTAWQAFDEAKWQAMQAGKRAKMHGKTSDARQYLKRHKAPAVTVEQLLAEAYELGYKMPL